MINIANQPPAFATSVNAKGAPGRCGVPWQARREFDRGSAVHARFSALGGDSVNAI